MQKHERHKLILDLISERDIGRQDELTRLLHEQGVIVTQASISRDLDELGVVKINGRYTFVDLPASNGNPFQISAIDTAGENLVVVKCASGLASAATVRIDAEQFEEVVGTIAGDDTIFIAVNGVSDQRSAVKKLRTLFAGG